MEISDQKLALGKVYILAFLIKIMKYILKLHVTFIQNCNFIVYYLDAII